MKHVPHFVAKFYGRIGIAGREMNDYSLIRSSSMSVFNNFIDERIALLLVVTLLTIAFFSQFARNVYAKSALSETGDRKLVAGLCLWILVLCQFSTRSANLIGQISRRAEWNKLVIGRLIHLIVHSWVENCGCTRRIIFLKESRNLANIDLKIIMELSFNILIIS